MYHPPTRPAPLQGLQRAWPMRRAASLFCGAGGACLGLRQAGYEVVAGVDFDAAALATYEAAGGHPIQHKITVEEPVPVDWIERLSGLDLLWASPPCQPWSQAGKRLGSADDRDAWPQTIEAVRLLRPRWFVAENVKGVQALHRSWTIPALEALGYVASFRVLDPVNWGLPQRRQRVILVAGPEPFPWPVPTHGKRTDLFVRETWQGMGEALGIEAVFQADSGAGLIVRSGPRIIPDGAPSFPIRGGGAGGIVLDPKPPQSQRIHPLDAPAPTIDGVSSSGGAHGILIGQVVNGPHKGARVYEEPRHPTCRPELPATTIRSGGNGHSAPHDAITGKETSYVVTGGLEPERLSLPSPAVLATEAKGARHQSYDPDRTPNRASDALYRGTGRRRLTPEEAAILQGFPADYPWRGGITALYRQIGNACPAILARVIAERIP